MTFYFHVHRQGRTITKSFGRTRDRAPKQAAGVAYFNEEGELLLCKRRTGIADHPGEWAFPAGGVEPGESPAAAARREFKEEMGHSLPSLAQQPAVENGSFTAYVYWGESFTPDLDHEHTECGWFHTEHLPEPTHPGVVAVLEALPTVVLAHLLSERASTQDADFKEDEHPNGDVTYTVRGGGSTFVHNTKTDSEGSILHHRVEMPTTIQTVKGPAPGITQKGLNPNQAAKHAGVYKDLGLVPWHKQDPTP